MPRYQRSPVLRSLITALNTVELGDLEKIRARLVDVRAELERRQLVELVGRLDDCIKALERGDLPDFRRIKATIVSRLGHLG